MSPQGIRIRPISCYQQAHIIISYEINKALSAAGEETVFYVYALLALRKRDLAVFWLTFVGLTKLWITTIETKWKQLCTDIERGQLEMNEEYEIVVTNNRGLYRYRCGDVIQVVGFFNDLPLIHPSYRSGQILNVASEKLTETALTEGLNIAADYLDISLIDYTAVEGPLFEEVIKIARNDEIQGLYEVVFIEITAKSGQPRILKSHEKAKFDGGLIEAHEKISCQTEPRYSAYYVGVSGKRRDIHKIPTDGASIESTNECDAVQTT
ncbi:uncharacterized protein LOC141901310 [Tubulanus polymorphus]|uniref:uncharacterized protein LOC141901310 n=1 Tax=Tubulanus polymorphus TaxID=672921 RepID=UPI003DA43E3C